MPREIRAGSSESSARRFQTTASSPRTPRRSSAGAALEPPEAVDAGVKSDAAPASTASGGSRAAPAEDRRGVRGEDAVVWKRLADDSLEPARISLGITDHTYTQVAGVLNGKLEPNDDVVTSSVASKSLPPGAQGIRR